MPLSPINTMMKKAMQQGYAVGYFESWNIESLYGVIEAAEDSRSPVIIGFNGEFLSEPERTAPERLSWYGALGRAAAESASMPCGFIFNECPFDDWVRRAVTAGFNLVMPVPAHGEADGDYKARVRSIVEYAHRQDVAVEAELGTLPFGGEHGGQTTDPDYAASFVKETEIDLLAVSVGNIHVLLEGRKGLDLRRIEALRKKLDTPMVLHGGTGISDESLKEAIALGMAKVNYGTVLKQRYLAAVRAALDTSEANPHKLLGVGGTDDVLVAGRKAVREAVLEKMELLGCMGKADG
jgi:ketose-bisphosphate aldolase